MGILIVIAVLAVLGLLYSWIASALAKESVRGTTGVLIMLLTGAVTASVLYLLRKESKTLQLAAATAAQVVVLAVLTRMATRMSWPKSAVLGVVNTSLIFGAGLALEALQ
jgi:hypothetical protein